MLHCLEVPHLCFFSDPGDACRDGRVQGGRAEDAYEPLALPTLPQRLHDNQINKKIWFSFPWWQMFWASKNDWPTSSEGQRTPPGHLQWQSDVGMRQLPVERIVTTIAGFSLKNLQKPHKKNNFFFLEGNIQNKSRSGLNCKAFGHRYYMNPPAQGITLDAHIKKKNWKKSSFCHLKEEHANFNTALLPEVGTEETQDKNREP